MTLPEIKLVYRVIKRGALVTRRTLVLVLLPCVLCVAIGIRGLCMHPDVTDYACVVLGISAVLFSLWRYKVARDELTQARAVLERHAGAQALH
jgi:hypothetical protein